MSSERLWNIKFVQLLCIEIMLQFGLYLTRPIISNYAVSLGASMTLAGFFAGLLASAALVTRPLCGTISDRLSKKDLLVISCALFTVAAFGCAIGRSIPLIGVFLALQGFAFAFKSTVIASLVSLVVPKKSIGSGIGWLSIAYTFACAAGPAVGSYVGHLADYSTTFFVSGALLLVGFVLAVFFKTPPGAATKERTEKQNQTKKTRTKAEKVGSFLHLPTIPLSIVAGLLMVAQGTTASFILLIGDMRGIEGASIYFLIYSLSTLAARPLAGKLSDIWGIKIVVFPMLIVATFGMLALAYFDTMTGIVIAAICMGLGQGSAYSAIQAESVRSVDESQLGRAANTFYIGPDLGMGFGPVLASLIFRVAGIAPMFLFNAASIAVSLIVFLIYMSLKSKRSKYKQQEYLSADER